MYSFPSILGSFSCQLFQYVPRAACETTDLATSTNHSHLSKAPGQPTDSEIDLKGH